MRGALTLDFRRSVPGKPPYRGAWPLNFKGCCPETTPKQALNFGAQNFSAKTLARGVARGGGIYSGSPPHPASKFLFPFFSHPRFPFFSPCSWPPQRLVGLLSCWITVTHTLLLLLTSKYPSPVQLIT